MTLLALRRLQPIWNLQGSHLAYHSRSSSKDMTWGAATILVRHHPLLASSQLQLQDRNLFGHQHEPRSIFCTSPHHYWLSFFTCTENQALSLLCMRGSVHTWSETRFESVQEGKRLHVEGSPDECGMLAIKVVRLVLLECRVEVPSFLAC
jgi:hypothetical protein